MKPVSSLQHHASPASIGLRSSERSLPYRWKQTSSRSVSRAPSPTGRHALLHQRVPDRRRRRPAGSGSRRRPRRCSPCRRRCRRRRPRRAPPCASAPAARRRSRSARPRARASGPCTASIAQRSCASATSTSKSPACSRNQARSFSWFEAFVTVRKRSVAEPVGEQVVEHAAVLAAQHASTARPAPAIFVTSFESSALEEAPPPAARSSRSRPCARRRRRPPRCAPRRAPGGCPRTGPASPSRRRARAARRRARGARTAGSGEGCRCGGTAPPAGYPLALRPRAWSSLMRSSRSVSSVSSGLRRVPGPAMLTSRDGPGRVDHERRGQRRAVLHVEDSVRGG